MTIFVTPTRVFDTILIKKEACNTYKHTEVEILKRTMDETMAYCLLKTKEMLSIIESQSRFEYSAYKKTCT